MIRIIGLSKRVLDNIPDVILDYVNTDAGIVEFSEWHYLHTYPDHVDVIVEDEGGTKEVVTFLYADFYRIELE